LRGLVGVFLGVILVPMIAQKDAINDMNMQQLAGPCAKGTARTGKELSQRKQVMDGPN
jgi:hypothetical protein